MLKRILNILFMSSERYTNIKRKYHFLYIIKILWHLVHLNALQYGLEGSGLSTEKYILV